MTLALGYGCCRVSYSPMPRQPRFGVTAFDNYATKLVTIYPDGVVEIRDFGEIITQLVYK